MERNETAVRQRHLAQQEHRRRQTPRRHRTPITQRISFVLLAAAATAGIFLPGKDGRSELLAEADHFSPGLLPASEMAEPATDISGPVDTDRWELLLVNIWNPLPRDYSVQVKELANGLQVDERCYPDLQAMMDACRAEGLSPVICSAYRTWEYQEQLYQAKVEEYLDEGYSRDRAEAEAGKEVAVPGTSEHQLGLALDIVDIDNQNLDETQESTPVQEWLMEHSWEYGFILRYPNGKSDFTGIIYEPWHYRYVGREDAERIHALGICLEEYISETF